MSSAAPLTIALTVLLYTVSAGILAGESDVSRRLPPGPPPGMPVESLNLPPALSDADLATAVHERLSRRADAETFSGVVLLKRDDDTVLHRGYGLADRATGRHITTETRFDIGSITKLLTRTAVAQLLQQGKLSLETPIQRYLPDYPNREVAAAVTVQHLVDHSSGLGDIFNERWMAADSRDFIEPRDFFRLFADEPLRFEPGTAQAYSNAGYIVLGAIIEAVSGKPYAEYMETQIFRPADMTRSGFEIRDGRNTAHAIGYAPFGKDGALVDNLALLPPQGSPAGSSMHTAEDLYRFDQALRANRLLDPEWTAWVFQSPAVRADARYTIGVAGGAPGVSTALESDGSLTVIVLSNFDPPAGDALARELFAAMRHP